MAKKEYENLISIVKWWQAMKLGHIGNTENGEVKFHRCPGIGWRSQILSPYQFQQLLSNLGLCRFPRNTFQEHCKGTANSPMEWLNSAAMLVYLIKKLMRHGVIPETPQYLRMIQCCFLDASGNAWDKSTLKQAARRNSCPEQEYQTFVDIAKKLKIPVGIDNY